MTWAWWPHTTDSRVASYRLRCLQIVATLRDVGQDVSLYQPDGPAPTVMVLSKRYDRQSVRQAVSLRERAGTRLVLDLCDNHFFFKDDPEARFADRADALREACSLSDLVIAASPALADVVRQEVPTANVAVIPDAVEQPADSSGFRTLFRPAAAWRMRRLESFVRRTPRPRRVIWFGSHGSPGVDAGLQDLAAIRGYLEKATASAPLCLTVVSNNTSAFETVTAGWKTPVFYLPWDASTFSQALRIHSLAIIPIGSNPFTRCKTANRVLTAAVHGLNVVADAIPSYEPMRDALVLDDWLYGLGAYLDDTSRRRDDQARLRAHAMTEYSLAQITQQWQETLGRLSPK